MAFPETGLLTSYNNAYMVLHEGNNYMADIQALRWEPNSIGHAGSIILREIFQQVEDRNNLKISIYVDFGRGNGAERVYLKNVYLDTYEVGEATGFYFKEYERV